MTATLAWFPLSPLRPWAMALKVVLADKSHLRIYRPFQNERRPVREHLAHRWPACRVAGRPRWAGRRERRELLSEPFYYRPARVADGHANDQLRWVGRHRHNAGHAGARAQQLNVRLFAGIAGAAEAVEDHVAGLAGLRHSVGAADHQRAAGRVAVAVSDRDLVAVSRRPAAAALHLHHVRAGL